MKKPFLFLIVIAVSMPAFADGDRSPYAGFQFGVAAPLAPVPMSSMNFMIGYANRDASTFLGRRVGFRLDWSTPVSQKITGYVYDDNNIHLSSKVIGIEFEHTLRDVFNPIVIHGTEISLNDVNGVVNVRDHRMGALVDFYPFSKSGFRFSGGYYAGRLDMDLYADIPNDTPADGFSIHLRTGDAFRARLQGGARAHGKLNWRYGGPYGGIGWDIGVYRGLRFFFDAGVIFTNAPKLYDNDIVLPYDKMQICYAIGNGDACGWTNIDKNDIPGTTANLIIGVMDKILTAPGGNFNGIDVSLLQSAMAGQDYASVVHGITAWVFGGPAPSWYQNVPPAIDNLVQRAIGQLQDLVTSDVQRILDEYQRGRRGAVRDVNDVLKDFQFYPVLRLGVMYRF